MYYALGTGKIEAGITQIQLEPGPFDWFNYTVQAASACAHLSEEDAMAIFIGLLLAALVVVYVIYWRDMQEAFRRSAAGSQMAQTPHGPIEYAILGEGPPLLVIHGAGGGFDQGLDLARGLAAQGFRVIAISRFGYLRTPLPADASPAAQADAHAALLDALNIPTAAIMGASAGAPSALQFAIRYPERTEALVLLVPATYAPRKENAPQLRLTVADRALLNILLSSDLLFWVARRLLPHAMMRAMLATPPERVISAGAEEEKRIREFMEHIAPVAARRAGLLNEAEVVASLPRYELERIAAPTLVIGVDDDLYGTQENARYTAEQIPNARLVHYPSGGHLLAGHAAQAEAEIAAFLREVR